MLRWLRLASAAAACVVVASCAGGPGDAGTIPVANGPVPAHPAHVSGPAVTGSVVDSRGRPAAGATIIAMLVLTRGEKDQRNAKSAFTLGIGCFDKVGCTTPSTTGRVAADGRFAVAVPTGVAAGSDPVAVTVVAGRGDDARVATTVVLARTGGTSLDAGRIPIAADAPRVVRRGSRARLVMPSVQASVGTTGVTMSRETAVSGGAQFVQRPPTTDASSGYDERVVEDGRILLVGTQTGTVAGRSAQFSASLVTTGSAVPPSRGSRCSIAGSRGRQVAENPCGLTDGMLDESWQPVDDPACAGDRCGDRRMITVTLPRTVRASLLVVRGCGFTCSVGVSADGRSYGDWRSAGDASPDDVFVVRLAASPVRTVRIQIAGGGFLDSLREVSVFG